MNTDETHDLVWGAREIGKIINRSAKQTFRLLEAGELPATKIGRSWLSSRQALKNRLVVDVEAEKRRA